MRREVYSFEVKASATVGESKRIEEMDDDLWITVGGAPFNATLALEGSNDGGATWKVIATVVSPAADLLFPLAVPFKLMRVNTTVYVGGTPTLSIAAAMNRS